MRVQSYASVRESFCFSTISMSFATILLAVSLLVTAGCGAADYANESSANNPNAKPAIESSEKAESPEKTVPLETSVETRPFDVPAPPNWPQKV